NWRAMLKGSNDDIDLVASAQQLIPQIATKLAELKLTYGEDAIQVLNHDIVTIKFPVTKYLTKISSLNFDKTATVSGLLLGIKGQYLIFDSGVINIRKFTSYNINVDYN
ncbi:MAG: DUF2797 domain-containing protein, partial [Alteromonadaceae bacterium]|nr:DUF2797 domain-containing protein [Alteromonadaceae bacterium]